jgi:hypothetical protein
MTRCAESARVLAAVRRTLSEEVSSLAGLSPDLKQHLSVCPACAAEAAAVDPTLLFAPLSASVSPDAPAVEGPGRRPAPPLADDARAVASAVLDEVRRRARVTSPEPLPAPRSSWSARRVAQVAAALLLTAGLAGLVRWEQTRPADVAANAPTPARDVAALAPEPAAPVRPLIQDVRNPNVRVYEFAAASPEEPAVVFVANPNADL